MLHFFKPYLNKDIKKIMSSYQANLYKDQRLDMGCQRRDSIYFKIKKTRHMSIPLTLILSRQSNSCCFWCIFLQLMFNLGTHSLYSAVEAGLTSLDRTKSSDHTIGYSSSIVGPQNIILHGLKAPTNYFLISPCCSV